MVINPLRIYIALVPNDGGTGSHSSVEVDHGTYGKGSLIFYQHVLYPFGSGTSSHFRDKAIYVIAWVNLAPIGGLKTTTSTTASFKNPSMRVLLPP